MRLWYRQPAEDWESESLPIGNGAQGASIFGGVESERVLFDEKTLWTGGPGDNPDYSGGIPTSPRPGALDEARRLILDEGPQDPEPIAELLSRDRDTYGAYQPFGDVHLESATPTRLSGYRRELDIANSVARVTYDADGVTYTREYFASHPDNVIVIHVTADQPGKVSLDVRMTTPHPDITTEIGNGRITIAGALSNSMALEAQLQVLNESGVRTDGSDRITVSGADAITVLLSSGTDYAHEYPSYKGDHPHPKVTAAVDAAAGVPYDELLARHQHDYHSLFDKVVLDIGQSVPELPTDELLRAYTGGDSADDRALEALYFSYGRYLLISSSRPGSLPANLQGVWNASTAPPWGADYHPNINLQMSYWLAEATNLTETTPPLFEFVDRLRTRGRESAKVVFDADGWVVNNETNPFDYTGVHDWPTAFWFPEAGAWLAQHLWEHYAFGRDERFLEQTAYPVLRETAEFWLSYLRADPRDGRLVAVPSYSPEHGPFTAGTSMSQQIVWDLFTNLLEAGEILDTDVEFRERVRQARDQLDTGLRIGRWGQLQEWKEDLDRQDDEHRHVSHLFALHPGRQISPLTTPELTEAAKASLTARGDGGTGWSKAWKVSFWARLLDGDHAHLMFRQLLRESTLSNLWDTHPPFQIDGNFGAAAGVAELLVQSHTGVIQLLPALPGAWPDGRVDGLRARGGCVIGLTWQAKSLTEARIDATAGGDVRLKHRVFESDFDLVDTGAGRSVPWERVEPDTIGLRTTAGRTYLITPSRTGQPAPTLSRTRRR